MKKLIRAALVAVGMAATTSLATAAPTVYIPLGSGNQVIAVDAATDNITATFTGVENPHGLVATPDGEYLVAGSLSETPLSSGQSAETPNSKLFLIHLEHGHVMLTIPVAGWTHHQAITPDGRYVISTHPTRSVISVVDMQSNQVTTTVKTGPAPNYTVITADGTQAFVTNSGNGTISEIDVAGWTVTRTLEGGPGPEHMVLSGDASKLFVTNPRAGKVSAISIRTGKIIDSWQVGANVHGLDIGDDVHEISLTPAPYHLNTIHGTGKVYVSSRKEPKIWVIDQKSLKVLGEITLPAGEGHQMVIVQ
jgi:YVTN family beta-propeller protein